MQEAGRSSDGSQHLRLMGVYHDRLSKSGGVWRFVARRFDPIFVEDRPWVGMLATARADLV
jgi:hypothetical protein